MRLRAVATVSFGRSELTNFSEWAKKNPVTVKQLGTDDVVLFVSKGGDQLIFVHGFEELNDGKGLPRRALFSDRVRLMSGTWNPLMLVNYAAAVGVPLEGLKKFENHYRALARKES